MKAQEKTKLFHFHTSDAMGNKNTLICNLINGTIRYIFYGGTGSSGTPFSLRNIQFYDKVNGSIRWVRDRSLPIENLNGESTEEFKERVKAMLMNSTEEIIKEVNTKVSFK
jgi:hypothetical protein